MLRSVIALAVLHGVALAGTTASISGSWKEDVSVKEPKQTLGVSFAAFTSGFAYWTWTGIGSSEGDKWFSTEHGLDYSAGPFKMGPVVEYKLNESDDEFIVGIRASAKLW